MRRLQIAMKLCKYFYVFFIEVSKKRARNSIWCRGFRWFGYWVFKAFKNL